jgi:hypothetical protein
VAAREVRSVLGRTYDAWFGSRTPVTRTQFWGLLLVGGMLIIAGSSVLLIVLSKNPIAKWDASTLIFVVLPAGVIFGGIIAFGVVHIKRAFAGRP